LLLSILYQQTHKAWLALVALTLLSIPGPVASLIWCLKGTEGSNCSLEEISRKSRQEVWSS